MFHKSKKTSWNKMFFKNNNLIKSKKSFTQIQCATFQKQISITNQDKRQLKSKLKFTHNWDFPTLLTWNNQATKEHNATHHFKQKKEHLVEAHTTIKTITYQQLEQWMLKCITLIGVTLKENGKKQNQENGNSFSEIKIYTSPIQ